MIPTRTRLAALHESAHVAAILAVDGKFDCVELDPEPELEGRVAGIELRSMAPLAQAAGAVAGACAEALYVGRTPEPLLAHLSDKDAALSALRACAPRDNPGYTRLLKRVTNAVTHNQPQIAAIANALLAAPGKSLTYQQCRSIFRSANMTTAKDTVQALAATFPKMWKDQYKTALATEMLIGGRATPHYQLAYDSATGNASGNMLRENPIPNSNAPKGGTSMRYPASNGRDQMGRGRDQMGGTNMAPPQASGSMDQDDPDLHELCEFVTNAYTAMSPEDQAAFAGHLQEIVEHHTGAQAEGPEAVDEKENMGPRGSNGNGNGLTYGYGQNKATCAANGPGASDRRLRSKRRGANDRMLRSANSAGFASRWPDAMRISIRG